MAGSEVTPELRRWIVEHTALGHTPGQLLTSMLASGWAAPAAGRVLEEVLCSPAVELPHLADLPPAVSPIRSNYQPSSTLLNPVL
jgi:hypothetical protein